MSKDSKRLGEELRALTEKMQSGVAMMEQAEWELSGIPPRLARELKHLRVGINSAMSSHAALAAILMKKGIITEEEYLASCVEWMQKEVGQYEQELQKKYGTKVTLGRAGHGST